MKLTEFESFDGSLLKAYIFEPKTKAKAVVQFAHGMQEYSATYFEFANFLADNGYIVVLFDQRGHGKSVQKQDLGKVGKEQRNPVSLPADFDLKKLEDDIFWQTLADHILLTKKLKAKYQLPVYFVGHSYGSFVGQAYLEQCKDMDKVVLVGSGYMKKPSVLFGKLVANIGKNFKGKDSVASMVEKLSFERFKKRFDTGSWVTSDEEETKKFYADELNGTPFSYGFYASLFSHQLKHPNKKALANVDKRLPILLLSGQDDVIGDMGKGTTKLFDAYKSCGLNVKMHLYPNLRHAILQECEKTKIFDEILSFLDKNS